MQNPQRFDNLLAKFAGQGREATARSKVRGTMYCLHWSNHKNAYCMQLRSVTTCVRPAGYYHIIICTGQAKSLSSSFTLNSDESVILQKLSLNMHTLRLKKNSLLFLLFIESSSGSVEGSGGKQIKP